MNYTDKWYIKINKSPVILLLKLLFLNILLDIIAIVILAIDYMDMISNWHLGFSSEEYFFLLTLFIQLLMIIIIFMKWLYKFYIFKDNKLIYHSWIIFKHKQEFTLNKIWCTDFEQSILWKIFNYWDILIYIQNKEFKLKWLNNPEDFIVLIWRFKEKSTSLK